MTYKEYINKQIKTGVHYYNFIPALFLILGLAGASITDQDWFYAVVVFAFFGLPQILSWNLKKNLRCPDCHSDFTKHLNTKMIHWNKNTFEWNACPECGTDYNKTIQTELKKTKVLTNGST